MNIGKSLKRALLDSGKTQRQVAKDLDISATVVSRHFNSKYAHLSLINKYAKYFGVEVSELIALSE